MNAEMPAKVRKPWLQGLTDAAPLLGGYIPVAMSFGLVAHQAGFTSLEATLISLLIYAGASQFLFVGMVAAGSPLWLVLGMTLLVNARHLVYAPNLSPWLTHSRWWPLLMHGLTDQIFALALSRLPNMPAAQRLPWFSSAMLLAWGAWVGGTALGAVAGQELALRWPLFNEVLPFALPALFLVLLAPRFTSYLWGAALSLSTLLALALTASGLANIAVPLAAFLGAALLMLLSTHSQTETQTND